MSFGRLDHVSKILNCLLLLQSVGYQLDGMKRFQKLTFSLLVHCFIDSCLGLVAFILLLFRPTFGKPPKLSPLNSIRSLKMFHGTQTPRQQSRPFPFWLDSPAQPHLLLASFPQYPHTPIILFSFVPTIAVEHWFVPGMCLMLGIYT